MRRMRRDPGRYSNIRMVLLAYVAVPNVVWKTSRDLTNVAANDAGRRALETFLA